MGFVKGMDVSMAKALEAHGASYYLDGKQDDLFRILKKMRNRHDTPQDLAGSL